MIWNNLLVVFILVSALLPSQAQSSLEKEDLCPDYSEVDPLAECTTVESYAELAEMIENAESGEELTLCPFFLRKVTSLEPITVKKGVQIYCARTAADQFCTIIGLGNHLVIDTAEDTVWQGFSFRGSNDHAVLVSGDAENSELATHTFCQTSFLDNTRTKETRGGAFMLEKSSGTINVVESFFQENFSSTFGAAIYSRASQLNILESVFVKNRSTGLGPALFAATDGSVMIKRSTFLSNRGRDGHAVVLRGDGTSVYDDGLDNTVNDGDCRGVFNVETGSCIIFEKSPPTLSPTNRPTNVATSKPTATPTKQPIPLRTFRPIEPRTWRPTNIPTGVPTRVPTTAPSQSPSNVATNAPTTSPSRKPTTNTPTLRPTFDPTVKPTVKPTVTPTATPTHGPTVTLKPPTTMPTRSNNPGDFISNKCLFRMISAETECVNVNSYEDFKSVIESANNEVIFCGGFNLRKTGLEAAHVSSNVDVRCIDQCSFFGVGPFLSIGGQSKIRIQNFKFLDSRDSSAVIVSTANAAAQTTFCDTEFARNQVSFGNNDIGGALTIFSRSGVVNIVNNTFTGNIASHGGAIHSNAFKLNIAGSKFVANNAYNSGNAIFMGSGHHLSLQSSTFILNTEVMTRSSGREELSSEESFAIVVEPNTSIRASSAAAVIDYGKNGSHMSGSCPGTYVSSTKQCIPFN